MTPKYRAMPTWTMWICGTCLALAASMGIWRTLHPHGGSVLQWMNVSTPKATLGLPNPTSTTSAPSFDPARFDAVVRTLGLDYVEPIRRSQSMLRDRIALLHLPIRVTGATTLTQIRTLRTKLDELPPLESDADARLLQPASVLSQDLIDAGVPAALASQGKEAWERAFGIDLASATTRRTIESDLLRASRTLLTLLETHHGHWAYDAQHDVVRFDEPSTQQAYDDAYERMLKLWKSLRAFDGVEA